MHECLMSLRVLPLTKVQQYTSLTKSDPIEIFYMRKFNLNQDLPKIATSTSRVHDDTSIAYPAMKVMSSFFAIYMHTWKASFFRSASFFICWMSPTARPSYAQVKNKGYTLFQGYIQHVQANTTHQLNLHMLRHLKCMNVYQHVGEQNGH